MDDLLPSSVWSWVKHDPMTVVWEILPVIFAFVLGHVAIPWYWVLLMFASSTVIRLYSRSRNIRLDRVIQGKLSADPALFDPKLRPSWAIFPDTERGEWFNKLLRQAWYVMSTDLQSKLKASLDKALLASKPALLSEVKVLQLSLGKSPPEVMGVQSFVVEGDKYILDLNIRAASDACLKIGARTIGLPPLMKFSIERLQFDGTLRIMASKWTLKAPYAGLLEFSLLNLPNIDFDIKAIGVKVTAVPGVQQALEELLKRELFHVMLFPRTIPVPLSAEETAARAVPRVLQVQSIKAAGLTCFGDQTDALVEAITVAPEEYNLLLEQMETLRRLTGTSTHRRGPSGLSLFSPSGSEPPAHDFGSTGVLEGGMHRLSVLGKRAMAVVSATEAAAQGDRMSARRIAEGAGLVEQSHHSAMESVAGMLGVPVQAVPFTNPQELTRLLLQHWSSTHTSKMNQDSVYRVLSSGSWDSWFGMVRFVLASAMHFEPSHQIDLQVPIPADVNKVTILQVFCFHRSLEARKFLGVAALDLSSLEPGTMRLPILGAESDAYLDVNVENSENFKGNVKQTSSSRSDPGKKKKVKPVRGWPPRYQLGAGRRARKRSDILGSAAQPLSSRNVNRTPTKQRAHIKRSTATTLAEIGSFLATLALFEPQSTAQVQTGDQHTPQAFHQVHSSLGSTPPHASHVPGDIPIDPHTPQPVKAGIAFSPPALTQNLGGAEARAVKPIPVHPHGS